MNVVEVKRVAQELQLVRSDLLSSIIFHGFSLYPFLQEGDCVVVEPVVWEDIRMGDLIIYRFEDKYPTRRVVFKGREMLVLWCDNWPLRRFTAGRDEVLGRAAARERNGLRLSREDPEWRVTSRSALRRYLCFLPLQLLHRSKWKIISLLRGRRCDGQSGEVAVDHE